MNKLSEKQLEDLQQLRKHYDKVIDDLGELSMKIHDLDKQISFYKEEQTNLLSDYDRIIEDQNVLTEEIYSQYGDSKVDLQTGEITNNQ